MSTSVSIENSALVLDLLEWLERKPRTYAETIDVWRTSCPRLSIWEDTFGLGYVGFERRDGCAPVVTLTTAGQTFLDTQRPDRNGVYNIT